MKLQICYVELFIPVAVLLLCPAVRRIPPDLERAARVDGCGWMRLQRHVVWPGAAHDAAVTWLIVFVLCLGEVGCSMLLDPPKWTTASIRAFQLIHAGVYRDLAVLALLSIAAVIVPWSLLLALSRRKESF